ncbi:MAG: ABC transporter permease subunit [Planctomycetes bacterium]|nr:ABC transporter permease subunit [Planctomycetota bacterium]
MLLLLRTSALLFRTHLARLAWSRRTLVCALLAALGPLVAFLIAAASRKTNASEIAVHVGYLLQLQVIVPVLALVAGSAAVAEEVEDRTITFLFSRPLPRASVLLGRWSAILVFLTVLLAASTWLLLAAAGRAKGPPLDDGIREPLLAAVLAGGAVYSALFAVLGVFVRSPVIVGLGYAFAIEGFLANMPAGTQSLTIQYYLRSMIAGLGSSQWSAVEGFASTSFEPLPRALTTLSIVLVAALALGAWRITRREFVLSS